MFSFRRVYFALCGLAAGAGLADAAETPAQAAPPRWVVPPLDGELRGELTPDLLPGAPPVQWTLRIATPRPRERAVTFLVEGRGLRVEGDALLDPAGEGAWRIIAARIDLAEWFGWLAPRWAPEVQTVAVAGVLSAEGGGMWRGGRLTGRVQAAVRDGSVDDVARKLRLDGVSLDLVLDELAPRRAAAGQVLAWTGGKFDVLRLGAGRVEFAVTGDSVEVAAAELEVLGGRLRVGGLRFDLATPEFAVTASMHRIELAQLLRFLPPVLSEARGKVEGSVTLRRDGRGIAVDEGRFALEPGETAELRLAPGLTQIAAGMPEIVRTHYPGLAQMEAGGVSLQARELEIRLTPGGDADGRTARLHVAGGPADPALRAPVVIDVNVRGPLEQLVRMGTDSRLRFGGERR